VRWAAHRRRRINRHHLAVDQPVEQVADGGEPELGGGRLVRLGLLLDPGGDMQRPDITKRGDAGILAPVEKVLHGRPVGARGMAVANIGGEEFKEPLAGIGRRPRRRWPVVRARWFLEVPDSAMPYPPFQCMKMSFIIR